MKKFVLRSAVIIGYLLIIFGVFGGLLYLYNIYSVKDVIVSSSNGPVTNILGLNDLRGSSMLLIQDKHIEKDLKKRNPTLQSIQVSKAYPSTLKISVTARRPLVALQVSDNGVFVLDRDGVILLRQQNYTGPLPAVTYYQTFQYGQYHVGNVIDYKDIVMTLFFIDELTGYGYPSQHIDIDGQYMIRLSIIGKKMFFFTSEKDKEIQIYQLKELLRQFKIQGKDFKTIDLRFDKPVITIK